LTLDHLRAAAQRNTKVGGPVMRAQLIMALHTLRAGRSGWALAADIAVVWIGTGALVSMAAFFVAMEPRP
jgi:hypothetical protein